MEIDRDTSLQSWEFLTLFLPRLLEAVPAEAAAAADGAAAAALAALAARCGQEAVLRGFAPRAEEDPKLLARLPLALLARRSRA